MRASMEAMRELRDETGGEAAAETAEAEAAAAEAAKAAHMAELRRRVDLAAEDEGGAANPYATLGLATNSTPGEVRRAYRELALRFHPDKNRGAELTELAHAAFQEVVAAFEILGTPDKRAAFDEAAGGGGRFADFDARWENAEFAWDSDMYKGAQYVTTLTERN